MTRFKKADVLANPNVQNTDILSITLPMINRMKLEDNFSLAKESTFQTIPL